MPDAASDAGSAGPPAPLVPEQLQQAEALVAAGQHNKALELTAALGAQEAEPAPASGPASLAAQLHQLRGRCHVQLGSLKLAIAELTAAVGLLQGQSAGRLADPKPGTGGEESGEHALDLCQLLLFRSSVYEQQEQLQAALADAEQASRLQQHSANALLAAQRLRRACKARSSQS